MSRKLSDVLLEDHKTTLDENGITLEDTVWDDMRVPVTATRTGGARDPDFIKVLDNGSASQGVYAQAFSNTTEEELFFSVQMPHSWKIGTPIHAHCHWVVGANGSAGQKVAWGLEYAVAKIGGVFGNTAIASASLATPDETLVAKKHYLTEIIEIDMSAVDSVSAMLLCRIFRDVAATADTYAADAYLLEIDFHYEIDSMGSEAEYNK